MISTPAAFALPFIVTARSSQAASIPTEGILVTSVSWIDVKGLPQVEVFSEKSLANYWPAKVAAGLAATRNPTPKEKLPEGFEKTTEFRSLLQYRLMPDGRIVDPLRDPGTTPAVKPENTTGWNRLLYAINIYKDAGPHKGQMSPVSRVVPGRSHPNTSLSIPANAKVLSSGLIKFRAGEATNTAGVESAKSPYHVPWVWCEHSIVRIGASLRIIANGSRFPSHAWYVNGIQQGRIMQEPVTVSDNEPAFVTGAFVIDPKTKEPTQFSDPKLDKSKGPINTHNHTVVVSPSGQLSSEIRFE